ncbi:unnamed protein product [Lota lota]
MDHQLLQNPIHYVVLLLLVVQWGRVLAAPVADQSGLCSSALHLTEILQHDASQLLDNYVLFHRFQADSIPEDVPDAKVNGSTPAEKLYSIAVQGMLFHWHLSVVEEDNNGFWANPDPSLQQNFTTTKSRLLHHFKKIGELLKAVDPDFISPTTPATPDLHIDNGYAKKYYGWGVITNLKVLATNVEQELNSVCGKDVQNILSV